jgi:hypothetical protein
MTTNRLKQAFACSVLLLLALTGLHAQQQTDPSLNTVFTVEDAAKNLLAGAKSYVVYLNQAHCAAYALTVANRNISIDAGRDNGSNPPAVPMAVTISAPDSYGFVLGVVPTKTPACDAIALHEDRTHPQGSGFGLVANTIDVGAPLGGAWYAAGPKDTWQPNTKTPPVPMPDGSFKVFLKIPAPVGSHQVTLADGTVVVNGGWYEVQ